MYGKASRTKFKKKGYKKLGQIERFADTVSVCKDYKESQEMKWLNVRGVYPILTSANVVRLNIPTSGTQSYQRIGRNYYNMVIYVRAYLSHNFPTVAFNPFWFIGRLSLVWDNQPNGVVPTPVYNDIFFGYDTNGATLSSPLGFSNLDNKDRFSVLRDETVLLPTYNSQDDSNGTPCLSVQGYPTQDSCSIIEWYVSLKGIETMVDNDGDVTTGSLLLLLAGYDPAIPSHWLFNVNARYRFTD